VHFNGPAEVYQSSYLRQLLWIHKQIYLFGDFDGELLMWNAM